MADSTLIVKEAAVQINNIIITNGGSVVMTRNSPSEVQQQIEAILKPLQKIGTVWRQAVTVLRAAGYQYWNPKVYRKHGRPRTYTVSLPK